MRLLLVPPAKGRFRNAFEIARILVEAGVSVQTAKRKVEDLSQGLRTYVQVPRVEDFDRFECRFMNERIAVRRLRVLPVDVKALRERLGLSQAEFAGRFGLDVANVRNWEQRRTRPDGAAATLLYLIDRDPDTVVSLLAS